MSETGPATIEITPENFEEVVNRDGIVLIDWWAPWCVPCRVFGPTYDKIASRNPDISFGKVNTEKEQALAEAFEIRSIPTLMILKDRVLVFSQPGALPEAALDDLVRKTRELDIEKVRAEISHAREGPEEGEKKTGA